MSDTAQGSGWWQASDGRWYPPDARPGVPPPPEAASAGWSSPPGGSGSGWGTPSSSTPGPWAQAPASQYRASTNGFAVAALVLGIIGIPAVLVLVGLRAPRPGEVLPCGHPAYTVFELGGVEKAVCVKGHAWTRLRGRWISASDPLAPAPGPR